MKSVRLALWFALGLLIGGFSVSSFAITVTYATPSSMITRSPTGSISSVNLPSIVGGAPTSPPVQVSVSNAALTLAENIGVRVLDNTGNIREIPAQQSVSLSGAKLAGLAAGMANLLKGGVQGAIINALASEAINLVNNDWNKTKTITGEYEYSCANAGCTHMTSAQDACQLELNRILSMNGYGWTYTSRPPILASNGRDYICRAWVVHPTYAEEESVGGAYAILKAPYTKTETATQADLENALNHRAQMMNDALKDYYNALDAQAQNQLAQDQSTKYAVSGNPVQGPSQTTTTQSSNGVKTSTTTTPTYTVSGSGDTYNTNNITVTTTNTTNTTTTNADGSTTSSSTTETTPNNAKEDYSFTDKDLPPVPDLYTPKYPDGLAGVWNEKIGTIKSSELFSFVNTLSSGAPSSGSCPSWTISFSGIGRLGSYTLQPPCIVWPFARWALLITALFVSRRLVFGG